MKTVTIEQPALVEQPESQALAVQPDGMVTMIERLAANPDVPVDKLERLIAMQERINAYNAKAAFDAAFAEMQGEIPLITERGEIAVNGQVRSKFAKFEDIIRVVRPILQKHGFAIRHQNQFSDAKIKIVGILSHRGGHSEQDEFEGKADDSGSKNAIQALGSTRSYGQRYTTISLLGIATCGTDDDGRGSERAGKPDAKEPEGFAAWWAIFETVASQGLPALTAAWNQSKIEHRNHLMATNKSAWNDLKIKAAKAVKS